MGASEDERRWSDLLELPSEQADQFQRLTGALETTPSVFIALMVRRVLSFERDLKDHGLPGFRCWLVADDNPPSEHRVAVDLSIDAWFEAFGISPDEAGNFERLALELKLNPVDIIARMIAVIVQQYGRSGGLRLTALREWMTAVEIAYSIANDALHTLPLRLRPSLFMWPTDKAFPWSAADWMAAVLEYEVKWSGDFEEFWKLLRGKWEMVDGYAIIHQI